MANCSLRTFKIALLYSKVEYHEIPFDFEGITIKAKGSSPRIIIKSSHTPERHATIPWHAGIIIDQTVDGTNESIETDHLDNFAIAHCIAHS